MELKIGSKVRLFRENIEYVVTDLRKKSIKINNGKETFLIEQWYADIKNSSGIKIESVKVECLEFIN